MVTNTLLTIDDITYKALRVLKGVMAIGQRCIRDLDSSFGVAGSKIGSQLRVRVPPRVTVSNGPAFVGQNSTETFAMIAAQNQPQVGFSYSDTDLSLALDDFSDKYIKTAMVALASNVDVACINAAVGGYAVANSTTFGGQYGGNYPGFQSLATPGGINFGGGPKAWTGNVLNSGVFGAANVSQVFSDAGSRLTEQLAPQDGNRYCVLSPAAKATTLPQLFVNFNPQKQVSEMFQNAVIGQFDGFDFFESVNIPAVTSGAWANTGVKVAVASQNGDTTIALSNVGNNAVFVGGVDQFTLSGVQSLSPVNYQPTGFLQVFTITNSVNANATGAVTLSVFPALQPNGQYAVTSAGALVNANVTFMGTSNTTTQTNIAYHKEALALAIAPLPEHNPGADTSMATSPEDGISIRYIEQYVATLGQTIRKFDMLFGVAVVRPQLGCLIRS